MSKYSNILKVPSGSDYALNLMNKLYNKMDFAENPSQNLIKNIRDYKKNINVTIDLPSDQSLYKEKSLNEIISEDKYAILTLNVIDYLPNNLLDFSQVFCPHCKERYLI